MEDYPQWKTERNDGNCLLSISFRRKRQFTKYIYSPILRLWFNHVPNTHNRGNRWWRLKSVSQLHLARQRSLFTDIPHFRPRLPPATLGAVSTLLGIYRSRSFGLIKRIINTYNGFLTPLTAPHATILRYPRGICNGATFFLRFHFSLSGLRSHCA